MSFADPPPIHSCPPACMKQNPGDSGVNISQSALSIILFQRRTQFFACLELVRTNPGTNLQHCRGWYCCLHSEAFPEKDLAENGVKIDN